MLQKWGISFVFVRNKGVYNHNTYFLYVFVTYLLIGAYIINKNLILLLGGMKMDSDFMNNLANMMKNGNIPDSVKEKMNRFYEPKLTDRILIIWTNPKMNQILQLVKIGTSNSINPEMLQNLMKMFSNSSGSSDAEVNTNNERR